MCHSAKRASKLANRFGPKVLSAALVGCALWLAGCTTLPWGPPAKEQPPTGTVASIVTTWDTEVRFLPDSQHNGQPVPCLSGKLFLFGKENGIPIIAPGELKVQLYCDDEAGENGQRPKLLEEWPLPAKVLKQVEHKELMGWGYIVPLPWATYHPLRRHLRFHVTFTPEGGFPVYSDTAVVVSPPGQGFIIHSSKTNANPAAAPVAKQ